MKRWIIEYETGVGLEVDVVHAETEEDAEILAREAWITECGDTQYEVKGEYRKSLAREYDVWDGD